MSLARYNARRPGWPAPGLWLLAGAGLAAGLALAVLFGVPRLHSTSPAAGASGVSSLAPVRLTFSRPMDHASVEAALSISPRLPGRLAWDGNTLTFAPGQPWPLSATVTVSLAGGRSQRGLPLLGRRSWSFTVGERRLAYLAGGDAANLWILPLAGDAPPRQVTGEARGIYDYDISPDGTRFVYAARRADGGADLRSINTDGSGAADLALCPNQACVSPAFSPDGQRLAYERHALVAGLAGDLTFGPAQVVVRNLADGSEQVLGDEDARFPRWGPDGRLAYLDTGRAAIVVQDLGTGSVTYVPNSSGEMGTWAPDGQSLVFSELYFPPEATPAPGATGEPEGSAQIYNYLVKVTIATNAAQTLSGDKLVDDASPVYSPSGAWLAFGRKSIFAGQWTPGRQLWLMRADGSEARALTHDPLYNHSAFRWGPDGTVLVYMRFNVADPSAPAEIWLAEVNLQAASADVRRLAEGYLPEWLP